MGWARVGGGRIPTTKKTNVSYLCLIIADHSQKNVANFISTSTHVLHIYYFPAVDDPRMEDIARIIPEGLSPSYRSPSYSCGEWSGPEPV